MDAVGGFLLADVSHAKALTGVDDHSVCVSWQQVCVGVSHVSQHVGVHVGDQLSKCGMGPNCSRPAPAPAEGRSVRTTHPCRPHGPYL